MRNLLVRFKVVFGERGSLEFTKEKVTVEFCGHSFIHVGVLKMNTHLKATQGTDCTMK